MDPMEERAAFAPNDAPNDAPDDVPATVTCACGHRPGDGDHAVAVDPEIKQAVATRLRRIEGQVRGLQRMVDEERYCADVLTQVSSVQEALRGVARTLLHNHLRHCATEAIRSGDPAQTEAMYQEIMDLFYRSAR